MVTASPIPNIWHYLALPAQPPSVVLHKCAMHVTLKVRKMLLVTGVYHFLTVFILLTTSMVRAAAVWHVGEEQAFTEFIHASLFFFSIVNYSGRLEECI